MLPKSVRLNLKKDFKRVASGKKIETKFLKLFINSSDPVVPVCKIGIALSSNYFKKATERNRARRLVSAAFEVLYPKLPTSINVVVLPKANVLGVKSGDILLDLEESLKKGKVINEKQT